MPTAFALLIEADHLMADAAEMSPEEFEAALASWVGDADDKLARLAAVAKAAGARIDTHKREVAAYQAAIKRDTATVGRVGDIAAGLLRQRAELGEEPRVRGIARLQVNGGVDPIVGLDTVAPEALPDDLVKIERTPDAAKIRAALVAGREIPGVALGERGMSLRWE